MAEVNVSVSGKAGAGVTDFANRATPNTAVKERQFEVASPPQANSSSTCRSGGPAGSAVQTGGGDPGQAGN